MAKKPKETTASTPKKEAKVKAPATPEDTRNLLQLLNILVLLLAILAFAFQFFAVISHHWKWQKTNFQPIFAPKDRPVQAHVYEDSRIYQTYGLCARDVKLYANNDEQLDIDASTRFPRLDNGDDDLHKCLSQTYTLRGALLTCADGIASPGQCHCRRYPHWNAIIFFEISALVLLGLVVLVTALLTTKFREILKLAGAGLSFLAFLFLLLGLILLLSYLKRETRTIADTYPHIYSRLTNHIAQRFHGSSHKIVVRQAHETYRAYSLLPGQHPFNQTHFQQYSEQAGTWIQIPYSSLKAVPYEPRSQQATTPRTTTEVPAFNQYGPLIGYNQIFENTNAGIGWSAVLSIIALILALLIPLLLAFSFLTAKKLKPETSNVTTTTTTTTIKTGYSPVPQEIIAETVPLTNSSPTEEVRQQPTEQVIVHDVVVSGEPRT